MSTSIIKSRKFEEILDIPVSSTSKDRVLAKVASDIKNKHKFLIVTPNPEMVMLAQDDEHFKTILKSADISIADGVGLVAAHKFLSLSAKTGRGLKYLHKLLLDGWKVAKSIIFDRKWLESDLTVIKGRELFVHLIKLADDNSWKVFLLGGEGNEAKGTKLELEKSYRNVIIDYSKGPLIFDDGTYKRNQDKIIEEKTVKKINDFCPQLLFVGFGAPKQEKWTYRLFSKLNIGGAMMVGGTFKYISGKVKLPPKFISDIGLEWLWRYITGNQESERIKSAVWQFPLKVFASRLLQKS